jgi:pimeloyl-ACP methyl ester carboxylesterase
MKIFIIFFTFISFSFASAKVTANSCKEVTVDSCNYTDCRVKLAGYPQEIAILSPKDNATNILQYHFHGFRFNDNYSWQFDRSLNHVIQGFQLERAVCGDERKTLIIPYSSGQNIDYRNYFISADKFTDFHHAILQQLNLTQANEIHLSAHSGGGKTVSMIAANSALSINKVIIYDGIYGQTWSDDLIKWVKSPEKKSLKLVAVAPAAVNAKNWKNQAGEAPFNFSRAIILQNNQDLKLTQQNKGFLVRSQISETMVEFIFEANNSSNHYTILTHWWE